MYVRIVRGHARRGQVEELVRRWQDFIVPRLQASPGFVRVYFCGECDADALAAVSIWETRPDADALNRAIHDFTAEVRTLLRGQPTIEDYEILAEHAALPAPVSD